MHEPSLRTSRLVIAGGFLAATAIGAAGFFIGRATSPSPDVPVVVVPVATPRPTEQPGILTRADILALASRAADAVASGNALPPDISGLAGRRFELSIPFGCEGPSPKESSAPLRWHHDAERQALRVHVSPTAWTTADWGLTDPAAMDRIGEGFWITRPWSSAETCPEDQIAGPEALPGVMPEQTLAVAQFNPGKGEGDGRRIPRSFDTVKRMASGQMDTARGFRMRLTGRVEKLPGEGPVRCIQPAGAEQRPVCIVAASFHELRIESAGAAGVLATWSLGQPAQAE